MVGGVEEERADRTEGRALRKKIEQKIAKDAKLMINTFLPSVTCAHA
jgi:hypothetical protein